MTRKNRTHQPYLIALLLCILQAAGIDAYAQTPVQAVQPDTTVVVPRLAPKARARRHREQETIQPVDSLKTITGNIQRKDSIPPLGLTTDSITGIPVHTALADSLEKVNKANLQKMQAATPPPPAPLPKDSLAPEAARKIWVPNSTKATWLALVFPGGGQIYNRKYWKLPIIYGGFAGCAYALSWNGKMYKDYSQAYLDIMDNNPNTNSFEELLPPGYKIDENQLKDLLRKRKDSFRRFRDLSIFAFIGVYLISVIDAYVDAELSNFDISPDLSMRVEPTIMNDQFRNGSKSVGVQCSLRF